VALCVTRYLHLKKPSKKPRKASRYAINLAIFPSGVNQHFYTSPMKAKKIVHEQSVITICY